MGILYQGDGLYEYAWTDLTTGSSYALPGAGSCAVDNDTAEYIAGRPLDSALCPLDPATQYYLCALGEYGSSEWYETSNSLGVSSDDPHPFVPQVMTNDAGNAYLSYVLPDSNFYTHGSFYTEWNGFGP